MTEIEHLSADKLELGVEQILAAPSDVGTLKLIVVRPDVDQRETPAEGHLDTEQGLVGDNWPTRGKADPDRQLTIMNARVTGLVAQTRDRWPLAGDQLYLDMDLSIDNLPPGTQLAFGDAIIEVTEPPHTGCKKFAARFGMDAVVFVNSGRGRKLNFRGINAKIIQSGDIKVGDVARKL
jgi:MOSC domain-containing protein YiiM